MFRLRHRLALTILMWCVALGCIRDKGYARFLKIKCNVKILPDTPTVKIGDTIRIVSWIPYTSFDYESRTRVDIRDMQVSIWGGFTGFTCLDTTKVNRFESMLWPAINSYFNVRLVNGEFVNLNQNFYIKNFQKTDTCFLFEMQLVPLNQNVYFIRPQSDGRAIMNNGSWRVDIVSEIVNNTFNQYLKNEVTPWLSPWQNDYFFKTVQ